MSDREFNTTSNWILLKSFENCSAFLLVEISLTLSLIYFLLESLQVTYTLHSAKMAYWVAIKPTPLAPACINTFIFGSSLIKLQKECSTVKAIIGIDAKWLKLLFSVLTINNGSTII